MEHEVAPHPRDATVSRAGAKWDVYVHMESLHACILPSPATRHAPRTHATPHTQTHLSCGSSDALNPASGVRKVLLGPVAKLLCPCAWRPALRRTRDAAERLARSILPIFFGLMGLPRIPRVLFFRLPCPTSRLLPPFFREQQRVRPCRTTRSQRMRWRRPMVRIHSLGPG